MLDNNNHYTKNRINKGERMKAQFLAYDSDANVSYKQTTEKEMDIFNKIISFCKKHDCFSGESLMQSDDPIIDAPELLSEIIDDIIKFEVEFHSQHKPAKVCQKS